MHMRGASKWAQRLTYLIFFSRRKCRKSRDCHDACFVEVIF